MSQVSSRSPEHLSNTHYATVVLRVVVNERSQIVQGELIDTATAQTTHFKNWRGLIQALSRWSKSQPAPADRSYLKSTKA